MNDLKRIIIVLLGLTFVGLCATSIKGHMDSAGYKNQVNYTTAIKSKGKDDFNYIVDSQQGRVLARGTFDSSKSKLAKFPEMNKGYTYVGRIQEHYTMHTRTVCSGSGKTRSCHTEVYYSWDAIGSDDLYADKINLFGRNYQTELFYYGKFNNQTNCLDFSKAGESSFFRGAKGCVDGYIYTSSDDRYVYNTVPTKFTATFLATTYGGLKPFEEDRITLEDKTPEQIINDVGRYGLVSFWTLVIVLFFLTVGACVAAYYWVMADGYWSMEK